jgi:hypothetical protein
VTNANFFFFQINNICLGNIKGSISGKNTPPPPYGKYQRLSSDKKEDKGHIKEKLKIRVNFIQCRGKKGKTGETGVNINVLHGGEGGHF